jgi:hypothetical protein
VSKAKGVEKSQKHHIKKTQRSGFVASLGPLDYAHLHLQQTAYMNRGSAGRCSAGVASLEATQLRVISDIGIFIEERIHDAIALAEYHHLHM